MTLQALFIGLALLFAAANVAVSIMIMHYLERRGIATNLFLIRLYIFEYVSQYRRLTITDTGSTGPLFYAWIATINLMALSAIGLLIAVI